MLSFCYHGLLSYKPNIRTSNINIHFTINFSRDWLDFFNESILYFLVEISHILILLYINRAYYFIVEFIWQIRRNKFFIFINDLINSKMYKLDFIIIRKKIKHSFVIKSRTKFWRYFLFKVIFANIRCEYDNVSIYIIFFRLRVYYFPIFKNIEKIIKNCIVGFFEFVNKD